MDILSELSYTPFDDFYIKINSIRCGWMDICVGLNGKRLQYNASYICDPLNDLLEVVVAIARNKKIHSTYYEHHPRSIGNYHYVFHNCEGWCVMWLFKFVHDELTLLVWECQPSDTDTLTELAEADFDRITAEDDYLIEVPDLIKYLSFAIKGPAVFFIKALKNAIDNLPPLPEDEEENFDNWGFDYSTDHYNVLKEWLITGNN